MTDERMALLELVEKGADADLVRDMLAFAADRIMDAEAEVAACAAKGARSPLREVYRNGYREQQRGQGERTAAHRASSQGGLLAGTGRYRDRCLISLSIQIT